MAKFRKLILTPGIHRTGKLSGKEETVEITADRIRSLVENTNRLRDLGVHIPAPFAHLDGNDNVPLPVIIGDDGATLADAYPGSKGLSWDASLNGGFWNDPFEIDPETGGLVGTVESPGDENDTNSTAGKIGKVVKETSIFTLPGRKVLGKDGQEHEIGEHLAHVAMCLHSSVPGQRNFEPAKNVPESDKVLAMSLCMSDLVTPGAITPGNNLEDPSKVRDQELIDVVTMLANVAYISMPPTTDRDNFIANLSVCLRQKAADKQEQEKEQEALTQRPAGANTNAPSIAMSQQASGNVNSSDAVLAVMMSNLVKTKKGSLKERIDRLVATGRVRKDYADSRLYPKVEALIMSPEQVMAAKGEIPRDGVEDLIEALEETQPLAGGAMSDNSAAHWGRPPGADVEGVPNEGTPDIAQVDADEIISGALQYA
jgi:hypothetical protein